MQPEGRQRRRRRAPRDGGRRHRHRGRGAPNSLQELPRCDVHRRAAELHSGGGGLRRVAAPGAEAGACQQRAPLDGDDSRADRRMSRHLAIVATLGFGLVLSPPSHAAPGVLVMDGITDTGRSGSPVVDGSSSEGSIEVMVSTSGSTVEGKPFASSSVRRVNPVCWYRQGPTGMEYDEYWSPGRPARTAGHSTPCSPTSCTCTWASCRRSRSPSHASPSHGGCRVDGDHLALHARRHGSAAARRRLRNELEVDGRGAERGEPGSRAACRGGVRCAGRRRTKRHGPGGVGAEGRRPGARRGQPGPPRRDDAPRAAQACGPARRAGRGGCSSPARRSVVAPVGPGLLDAAGARSPSALLS